MFENIGIFRTASGVMSHASVHQTITAQNIANAETPGYQAKTVMPFELEETGSDNFAMKQTRSNHFTEFETGVPYAAQILDAGKSVDLESEMLAGATIQQDHNRAMTVYRSALGMLRTSLGNL